MSVTLELIGIAVKDMSRSLAFYRTLGVDIPDSQDAEPHVDVVSGGVRLAWDTIDVLKSVYGEWNENPTGHRIELAFECESRADVDAVYQRLIREGHQGHREPWDAFWGQRYGVVVDPDGNLISLFA